MKWRIETNGEGAYWWVASTPLGDFVTEFDQSGWKAGIPWRLYLIPEGRDEEIEIGAYRYEEDAKAGCAEWIADHAREMVKVYTKLAKKYGGDK